MYKEFYGFKENPFTLRPDPAFLYLTKQHQSALTMLTYSLQSQVGIAVITGEVGAGKTILIREILSHTDEKHEIGLISNAHSSFGDLLQWILMAFNIDSEGKDKGGRYQLLVDFLINNYAENKNTVLIIDEAQNMDVDTLEELRLISNINADKHLVIQLVLVGQPELLEMLQKHELRQLAQRVSVDCRLKSLSYKETVAYIKHRLTIAGGSENIFDKYAIAAVFYHSGGIPRLINTLCDFSLVFGYSENIKIINLDMMLDVIKDKLYGGIFPVNKKINVEQAKIRQLIKQEHGRDIQLDIEDEEGEEFFEI